MWHVSFLRDNFNSLKKKLNGNLAHNKSSMKPSGFKNIILLYNLLLVEAFSLLVWYVSENTTFKVVVLKQFKKPCIYLKLLPSATKLQRLCFTGVCLSTGGVPAPRGVPAPGGGCLLWGACSQGGVCSEGACSRGVSARGCLLPGGGVPACTEADPPCPRERWLLLQTVRILLFILFSLFYFCELNLPTLQVP